MIIISNVMCALVTCSWRLAFFCSLLLVDAPNAEQHYSIRRMTIVIFQNSMTFGSIGIFCSSKFFNKTNNWNNDYLQWKCPLFNILNNFSRNKFAILHSKIQFSWIQQIIRFHFSGVIFWYLSIALVISWRFAILNYHHWAHLHATITNKQIARATARP